MTYEVDTRGAYRSHARASGYRRHQTSGFTWARLATRTEQRGIRRLLRRYLWTGTERILDMPCGSGILGGLLHTVPARTVASDISREMMELGRDEYTRGRFLGCVQGAAAALPFQAGSFRGVLTLGFLHRVPRAVRLRTLSEVGRLATEFVIVTYSLDNGWHRFKRRVVGWLVRDYRAAAAALRLADVRAEITAQGFVVRRWFRTVPGLSSEAVFLLERAAE